MPLPERKLVSRIQRLAAKGSRGTARGSLIAGIGDDCAVLRVPAGHEVLVTTDFSLEGVHFRREWHSPEFIGHRCLTRGLSDIAAMGGEPIAIFLSLALPSKTPQPWVDGFLHGLLKLAETFDVPLAGGDTTQSPERILADIVVLGTVPRGAAIHRSGARAGDSIYVTGALGTAAAETRFLYEHGVRGSSSRITPPQPRLAVGRFLREHNIPTAMIDISDGLSTDLSHICEESGIGAKALAESIPRGIFRKQTVDLSFALHGGDAYELLFTARKETRVPDTIAGVPITLIGEITPSKSMKLIEPSGKQGALRPQGWEHFRNRL